MKLTYEEKKLYDETLNKERNKFNNEKAEKRKLLIIKKAKEDARPFNERIISLFNNAKKYKPVKQASKELKKLILK